MKNIIFKICLALAFSLGTGLVNGQNKFNTYFKQYSFDAKISDLYTISAEISSTIDSKGKLHLAWIKDSVSTRHLMYTVIDTLDKIVTREITGIQTVGGKNIAPNIVTDHNDRPHIAFFRERGNKGSTRVGNFAIYYAGDSDGDNVFEISQVSTNSTDSTSTLENIYNAGVGGLPIISIGTKNEVIVSYDDFHSLFPYRIITAIKNGKTWDRFISTDKSPYSAYWNRQFGISENVNLDSLYYGFCDNSNAGGSVTFFGKQGNYTPIIQFTNRNFFPSPEIVCSKSKSGKNYSAFFASDSNCFYKTYLSGNEIVSTQKIPLQTVNNASNFMPLALDYETDKMYYIYKVRYNTIYRLIYPNESNSYSEIEIKNIEGLPLGKKSLNIRAGKLWFVTADDAKNKIYITRNNGKAVTGIEDDYLAYSITVFPNPATNQLNVSFNQAIRGSVSLLNLQGEEIQKQDIEGNALSLSTENIPNGVYLLKVVTEKGTASKQVVILK